MSVSVTDWTTEKSRPEISASSSGLVFGDDTAALCDKTEEIAQVEIIVFHGEFGTVFDGQQVKKEVLQKLWGFGVVAGCIGH